MQKIRETNAFKLNGFAMLLVNAVLLVLGAGLFITGIDASVPARWIPGAISVVLGLIAAPGYFTVQPNQARVLIFFGRYTGSTHDEGFWWANPFAIKKKVSLRVRNLNTKKIKVNDASGNPIEIAAVVVWRIEDSAAALFDVDDYQQFVDIQSETAVRGLANRYPYDPSTQDQRSLRGDPEENAEELRQELQERVQSAGAKVIEARLMHLAYAPEIAQAMLKRQQAAAVVAARKLIVDAAVGMVQHALEDLSAKKIVELDEEKKAAMVNNLMVVLTSEHEATPVLNTGTLYT